MKIIVVVPVYNEESRVVEVIKKILESTGCQIVVVNDGSTDDTRQVLDKFLAKNKRVTLLNHLFNLGKGASVKTGVEKAWILGAEAVVIIDADGQHSPKDLPRFEKALKRYLIVFGYREFDGEVPYIRKLGNIVATNLVGWLWGVRRKDLLSGFIGFRKEIYKQIYWYSRRYGLETEIATKVGRYKIPFKEIKIDTIYLDKYKGVSVVDAIKILGQTPVWFFEK
jgi:glycosyltransferase involved in cell wall biosynthesis